MLLPTAAPGIGKTTVIRRVAAQLAAKAVKGFHTQEIREGSARTGFGLVGLEGQERVIAHVSFPKSYRVGKFGVRVAAMDDAALLLVRDPTAHLYLVDEIGKMERLSQPS